MTETSTDTYDQFVTEAQSYDVEVTRVSEEEVSETLADAVEPPAVGAPLPWEGVSLPEDIPTDPSPATLDGAVTGVTPASLAIADYGSLVLEPSPDGREPVSLFVDLHVAVLREGDIVPDMPAAFEWLGESFRENRGSAILATGPSATADMGALVKGAHGPKDVHVVVVR